MVQYRGIADCETEEHLISQQRQVILAANEGVNGVNAISRTTNYSNPEFLAIALRELIVFFISQRFVRQEEDSFATFNDRTQSAHLPDKGLSGTRRGNN